MQIQTKVFTTHVPVALAKKIDDISERLERSRSWVVKKALVEWVTQEEADYEGTLEALKEVETGHFNKHDPVKKWANSLTGAKMPLIWTNKALLEDTVYILRLWHTRENRQ